MEPPPSLLRPGGLTLTDHAWRRCAFPPGARLLDVGCGSGATVRHLRQLGCEAYGVDARLDSRCPEPWCCRGTAEALPFASCTFDGILMECVLSLVERPEQALASCHRVLKPQGTLILSDVVSSGATSQLGGCLGRVEPVAALRARLEGAGFQIWHMEDHRHALQGLWGQWILDRGMEAFCKEVGTDCGTLKALRCGYTLLLATRETLPWA